MHAAVYDQPEDPRSCGTPRCRIPNCARAGCWSTSSPSRSRAATCCTAPAGCCRPRRTSSATRRPGIVREVGDGRHRLQRRPAGGRHDGRRQPRRDRQRAGRLGVRRSPTGCRSSEAAGRPDRVRHRRRLPVRVRPPAAAARPCWSRPVPVASASPRSSWPRPPGAAMVIATASSDERLERLHDYGMDHGIDYATRRRRPRGDARSPTAAASTSSSTPSAAARWRPASPSLAYRGRISWVGNAGREDRPPQLWPIMQKNALDHRRVPRRRDGAPTRNGCGR